MPDTLVHITSETATVENEVLIDYAELLEQLGVNFSSSEYYWQSGSINAVSGWVLHLSVIRPQIPALLNTIVPYLLKQDIPFKVIRDYHIAGLLLDGSLGQQGMCKMICIYPSHTEHCVRMAKQIIAMTKEFRGPYISTDRQLGSIVYTIYEEFAPVKEVDKPIPFKLPIGVAWPFGEIATPEKPASAKLLNAAYYPLFTMKKDPKGDVMRGLYFKKLWQIKYCVIKQGRKDMFADDDARDIRDRLDWQHKLYQELGDQLPIPRIFDYFSEGEDTYLAMEFIKGMPLAKWISNVYYHRTWSDLPYRSRNQLLVKLAEILEIINLLHNKGYIHRDITPENFLIDKKEDIFLIDMELTWCTNTMTPAPPFKLGTPGFMSPEQFEVRKPTPKEDIYGLGALMVTLFTDLSPAKFEASDSIRLTDQLIFLTGVAEISGLIAACLEPDPALRPELPDIQRAITGYISKLKDSTDYPDRGWTKYTPSGETISAYIQAGLNALSLDSYLTPKKRWCSRAIGEQLVDSTDFTIYPGFYIGMAGPLWLVSLAQKIGFDTSACQLPYVSSWNYITEYYTDPVKEIMPGLFQGSAGVAIALAEGLDCGLLQPDPATIQFLHQCFARSGKTAQLAEGWAGEGVAILKCSSWLGQERTSMLLKQRLDNILATQKTNGSWDLPNPMDKKEGIPLGLAYGVAGVIWFMLACLEKDPDKTTEKAVKNSLGWLIKQAKKDKGIYSWNNGSAGHTVEKWHTERGMAGIILVLIKAYQTLKDPIYKTIAEDTLLGFHPRTILSDFSLRAGMAGLGELYLDAYNVLGNEEFKKRADWIVDFFLYTFQDLGENIGQWLVHPVNDYTADLFTDNSGVLHFLIRHQYPGTVKHPLST